MSRKRKLRGGVGRDELFRMSHASQLAESSIKLIQGQNATAKRGKQPRGGNKRGSWGPQGDG